MSEKDFKRLSEFIHQEFGIKLPPVKKVLLESRLQKRLKVYGFNSFSEYCDFLFTSEGIEKELVQMIDLVTTNKTDFFREAEHFEILSRTAVPDIIQQTGGGVTKCLTVWCAGCSTGEEPYTIAMVLSDFAARYPGLGFKFQIIATDISTRVLDVAKKGIYLEERVVPIQMESRKKYLLRSRDRSKGLVRVIPELRSLVRFRRLNFMDEDFGFREPLDIIFCRNVMIYFDRPTVERLINKFAMHLIPGGYLFVGHSETLTGMDNSFTKVGPSAFKKC